MNPIKPTIKKNIAKVALALALPFAASAPLSAAPVAGNSISLKVGVVNFRKAVEESKLGKQEQEMLENMKKQVESILKEKGEEFQKLSGKLQDEDFRESQKPDALQKMEQQYQQLGQELQQAQGQYYQAMQQQNMRIIQRLAEVVSKASERVADTRKLDLVLNDDNAFFSAPGLDITKDVVAEMDLLAEDELKDAAKNAKPLNLDMKK
jgi:outer membrane protein